jgi:hypothetical protein
MMADGYANDSNYAQGMGQNLQPEPSDTLLRRDQAQMEPTRNASRSPLANLHAFLGRRMKKRK